MLFNPVINLVLTVISLALGTIAIIHTDNWLVMLPCLIFTTLFSLSLFRPVTERPDVPHQPAPTFHGQIQKLTARRLQALRLGSTAFHT